jgi:chloride channel 7
MAAGSSCGVSVAFGAPIGGALFMYELSNPNTFWKFHTIWKVFFCCCVGTFVMAMWSGIATHNFHDWSGADIKFGSLSDTKSVNVVALMPAAVVIGIIGGLLGAFFISVNTKMNDLRKNILTKKWMKPLETFVFCFITSTVIYYVPYWVSSCETIDHPQGTDFSETEIYKQAFCEDGKFNPLASFFWVTEGEVITNILSNNIVVSFTQLSVFFAVWYIFTITTYGTNVPAGLFLPGIILGCCLGELYAMALHRIGLQSDEGYQNVVKNYVVVGIAAMLAGYTRMTYSLAIIVMETA